MTAASLRARLEALETKVESVATGAAARLAAARQEASGEHASDLLRAISALLPALRERVASLDALRGLFAPTDAADAHGMEPQLWTRLLPLLEFLYGTWWRVEVRGLEHVPPSGPLVVVANHGGLLPWDALVLRLALLREHPARRGLRPLLDHGALSTPLAGPLALRLGAVPATPENALQILGAGGAVAVFPEGSGGSRRPWPQRYRIERFGRGGFAKLARRASAAIVPCAIVGSEETSAPFARAGWLAEVLGMPLLSATPPLPLAALGALPLPSRWSLRFGEPFSTAPTEAGADEAAWALARAEDVRAALQRMLDEDVAARRSIYL